MEAWGELRAPMCSSSKGPLGVIPNSVRTMAHRAPNFARAFTDAERRP